MILLKLFLSVALCVLTYALIIMFFSKSAKDKQNMKKRMDEIANLGKFSYSDAIETQSFFERIIQPAAAKILSIGEKVIPISANEKEKFSSMLLMADVKIKAEDFMVIRVIIIGVLMLLGGVAGFIYLGSLLGVVIGIAGGIYAGYAGIKFVLAKKITQRTVAVQQQLPEALDLLCVCVEAGLGFDQSVQYVITQCNGPLINEFVVLQRDMSLGRTRRDALQAMCKRCNVPELKTFATAVIQADDLGISLKNVLNSQSESIRVAHKQAFEEKAQKLPVKILIPMVCFIFPVLFIVILGPIVPKLMEML